MVVLVGLAVYDHHSALIVWQASVERTADELEGAEVHVHALNGRVEFLDPDAPDNAAVVSFQQ